MVAGIEGQGSWSERPIAMINFTSSQLTITVEDGKQVYPCWCGVAHRGEYAFEDWNHHNCAHDDELLRLDDNQVLCGICGMSWMLREGELT